MHAMLAVACGYHNVGAVDEDLELRSDCMCPSLPLNRASMKKGAASAAQRQRGPEAGMQHLPILPPAVGQCGARAGALLGFGAAVGEMILIVLHTSWQG